MTISEEVKSLAAKDKETYLRFFQELADYEGTYKVHIHLEVRESRFVVYVEGREWAVADGIVFTIEKFRTFKTLGRRILRNQMNAYKKAVPKHGTQQK